MCVMFTEKDFIEYLIFMNKFVVLWEILKYSPDSWESFSIVEDKETKNFVLKDKKGNIVFDDDVFDYMVEIHLNKKGRFFFERYLDGEFFKESEIPDIIREGLYYTYL